ELLDLGLDALLVGDQGRLELRVGGDLLELVLVILALLGDLLEDRGVVLGVAGELLDQRRELGVAGEAGLVDGLAGLGVAAGAVVARLLVVAAGGQEERERADDE